MARELDFNGIKFDDFVVDADGGVWSQVCNGCVDNHKIDEKHLSDEGSGICGVNGCDNESDKYIDWTVNEVTV
jgi:hypothetical protein